VSKLLASCDRRTLAGLRDYAILLVLTRLGLRAGEVGGLRLDDVDWRHGELLVRGKGAGRTYCRCPSMSASRWRPVFAVARGASAGRCSCGSRRRAGS